MSKTGRGKTVRDHGGRKVQQPRDRRIAQYSGGLSFNQWVTHTYSDAKKHAAVAAGSVVLLASIVYALPQGATVTSGNVAISQPTAQTMQINQSTNKAIINWQGYSIAASEAVRYVQPGASSIALNRVIGLDPSYIYGQLSANGQVWVINPNGLLVGANAKIETGSFLGSTLNISDPNFLSGNYSFMNSGSLSLASIMNSGKIVASHGGYVALLSPSVTNEGTIVAKAGTVALASGEEVTLSFAGNKLINLVIDAATQDALGISNSGTITATGGTVMLTARTASDILKNVVNNTGIIEARSLVQKAGRIILDGGEAGIVASSGTLDVSSAAAGAKGGSIGIFGQYVGLFDGSKVNASGDAGGGSILIGGNFHGAGPEPNASMTYVGSGVTISADAITAGNGGKVAVWSDDATWFYGNISARGGALGGDGGYVETSVGASGQGILTAAGSVNAGAPAGKGGTWLLDPNDITISTGGTGNIGTQNLPFLTTYYSTDDNAVLTNSTLGAALTNGTTVVVQTRSNNPIQQNGDITVDAPVNASLNAGQNATLNLDAQGNISFTTNGSITHGGGTLNVNLNAGIDATFTTPGTNPGSITMAAGSLITTGGGSVTATAHTLGIALAGINTGAGALTVNSNGGAIAQNSAITVNGGASFTAGASPINLSSFTNTFGGTVSLNTTGANNASVQANSLSFAASTIGGSLTAEATTGNITITGPIAAVGGVNIASSGTINETGAGLIGTTGMLTTTFIGGETLNGANRVGAFSATNSTSGNILLTNAGPLTIASVSQTGGGAVTVNNTGAVGVTGTIGTDGGGVNLTSSGTINETGVGLIGTTGTLTTTSIGGETLNGANTVSTFNAVNAGSGNIALSNTAGPLTMTGISNTGGGSDTVSTTGALTTTGNITTTGNGAISLKATGGTETIGAAVAAGGSGAVTLAATGASRDILINANVASGSGSISVTAGRDITLPNTSTDITTTGHVNLTAANNINGGYINGGTVTLNANTIGLAGQTNVNATGGFFGAIIVNATGEQNAMSATLYGSNAMFGIINPDPPGTVFYNGRPIDTATVDIFTMTEQIGGSTISVSAEKMQDMARSAGREAFFFMARPPFVVASDTEECDNSRGTGLSDAGGKKSDERPIPCEPGLTRIRVTEDCLMIIE